MGGRLLYGGIVLFLPLVIAGAAEPGSHIASSRTQYFEIVSPDGASTDFTSALSRRLVDVHRNWLRLPTSFSNRIFVRLEPPSTYRFDVPFTTDIEVAGNVIVTVRWDEASELEDLERALVRGLLIRLAIWNNFSSDSISIPPWLEMGMQRALRSAGNPSYVDGMSRDLLDQGPMPVREILYREEVDSEDEIFGNNAYWLLRHLQQHSHQSERLHNLVLRLLAGGDPEASMMATFGSQFRDVENIQLWWVVGVHDRIQRRALTQSHFFDSRRLLNSLSRFTYSRDGTEIRLGVEDLWEHRNEGVLQAELIRRLDEINFQMRSIHPFHFNAILSLRLVMLSLLEGGEEEFRRHAAVFRDDLSEAELIFSQTEEALDSLEEEIRAGN